VRQIEDLKREVTNQALVRLCNKIKGQGLGPAYETAPKTSRGLSSGSIMSTCKVEVKDCRVNSIS
jgi:hypothetical protein